MFKNLRRGLATLVAMAAGAYVLFIRPWHLRWGATDKEVQRPMPGDDQVPHPFVTATRAVTIDAPPEQVWPWLVQMGYRRAGWYAFERFDNDNIPSAEEIIPALQHLDIGQVIGEEGFAVQAIEPNRLLLLAFHYPKTEWVWKQGVWPRFGDCSWSLLLDPLDGGSGPGSFCACATAAGWACMSCTGRCSSWLTACQSGRCCWASSVGQSGAGGRLLRPPVQ